MGSISMPQGRGSIRHNIRGYEADEWPDNIDRSKTRENIVWKHETVAHAYHRIFDAALDEYNSRQKRADRKITNYRTHINNSKNGEKEFYEDVLQWGKKEDFAVHPELRQVAKECLVEYIKGFPSRNPNLELVGAYIHMDEVSPHMHFDYIPVASGYKTGLSKRNSLDRAMKQMGFGKTLRDKKDNATKQWKEHEREVFKEICLSHGLTVEPEHKARGSFSVDEYKEIKDSIIQEALEEKVEVENQIRVMQKELKVLQNDVQEAQERLKTVNSEYWDTMTANMTLKREIERLWTEAEAAAQEQLEKAKAEAAAIMKSANDNATGITAVAKVKANQVLQKAEAEAEQLKAAAVPEQIRTLQKENADLNRTVMLLKDRCTAAEESNQLYEAVIESSDELLGYYKQAQAAFLRRGGIIKKPGQ